TINILEGATIIAFFINTYFVRKYCSNCYYFIRICLQYNQRSCIPHFILYGRTGFVWGILLVYVFLTWFFSLVSFIIIFSPNVVCFHHHYISIFIIISFARVTWKCYPLLTQLILRSQSKSHRLIGRWPVKIEEGSTGLVLAKL